MNNDIVVIFGENGARILHGQDGRKYIGAKNALVNPAIPPRVPPHHWKIQDGQIVEMSDGEKRQLSLDPQPAPIKVTHEWNLSYLAFAFLFGAATLGLIFYLF